ncbi:MAG: hemin ABC transporter substrate-binding protein [Halomonadaceae bacterium]|nr:MAG: hemin ABC transporter substrate-binding protein [Halomonadaceae bacterium]
MKSPSCSCSVSVLKARQKTPSGVSLQRSCPVMLTNYRTLCPRLMAGAVLLCLPMVSLTAWTAERIVVADGALTEIVYALGAGERIVGVDTTSGYPAQTQALPNIGYLRALSAEGVLSLNPTLLLTTNEAGPPAVLQQLRGAGLRIEQLEAPYSLTGTLELIEEVGALLGRTSEAQALSNELADNVSQQLGQVEEDLRVMFLLHAGGQGVMASGTHTRADALLTMVGVKNVNDGFEGFRPLTSEGVLQGDPDVILAFHVQGNTRDLYNHPALRLTRAAREGRIHVLDKPQWLQFGPRLDETLNELTHLLNTPERPHMAAGRASPP